MRKLLIGLALAGLVAGGFGAAVLPASAELRTVTVTLLDGRQLTMVLDIPPGTPPSAIKIPGISGQVVSITEGPPPASSSTSTATAPSSAPAPSAHAPTVGAPPVGPSPATGPPKLIAGTNQAQPTTGRRKRKGQAKGKGTRKAAAPKTNLPARTVAGLPTPANPTFSYAIPGAAPLGVPDFFIEKFRVPLFLLPIYQAAGTEYGVPWQVLAAINEIETDYGRDLNVSSAGAEGWMQFLPSTWKQYGVDATQNGKKDPYNPADAIFAAARYLKAAGADKNLRAAIFSYNHATWYVDSVLLRAKLIGGVPDALLGSLTGLTEGHFPVHAKARYADDPAELQSALKGSDAAKKTQAAKAAARGTGVNIFAKPGSPVLAVQDGQIVGIGKSPKIGQYIELRDAYGNTYTYGDLQSVVGRYPVPKPQNVSPAQVARQLHLATAAKPQPASATAVDPRPSQPASAGNQPLKPAAPTSAAPATAAPAPAPAATPDAGAVHKERLYADPSRPAAYAAGGRDQIDQQGQALPDSTTFSSYFTQVFGLKRSEVVLKPLKRGSKVIAGTILGRIGQTDANLAPHVLFQVRPAGRNAPLVDPKPILDGWKLLESTAIYRAAGQNPFLGPDAKNPTIGQIFLMSKEALAQRVLQDPNVSIYDCGRRDIAAGAVDRRVLATLEFLVASGFKPSVSALKCGHSLLTTEGNVSEHSSGNAVDIAAINGIPIVNHQGPGSIADMTIRRLLTLQGVMKPHQIISLMTYPGTDNTLALPDHADHIHVGFYPQYGTDPKLRAKIDSVLKPKQWIKLIDRLRQIQNPVVPTAPSAAAIPDTGND